MHLGQVMEALLAMLVNLDHLAKKFFRYKVNSFPFVINK